MLIIIIPSNHHHTQQSSSSYPAIIIIPSNHHHHTQQGENLKLLCRLVSNDVFHAQNVVALHVVERVGATGIARICLQMCQTMMIFLPFRFVKKKRSGAINKLDVCFKLVSTRCRTESSNLNRGLHAKYSPANAVVARVMNAWYRGRMSSLVCMVGRVGVDWADGSAASGEEKTSLWRKGTFNRLLMLLAFAVIKSVIHRFKG